MRSDRVAAFDPPWSQPFCVTCYRARFGQDAHLSRSPWKSKEVCCKCGAQTEDDLWADGRSDKERIKEDARAFNRKLKAWIEANGEYAPASLRDSRRNAYERQEAAKQHEATGQTDRNAGTSDGS